MTAPLHVESPSAAALELSKEFVAPPEVQLIPPGAEIFRDLAGRVEVVSCSGILADVLGFQLRRIQELAAAGKSRWPFVDLNHNCVCEAGIVTDLWWAGPAAGIRGSITWSAPAARVILSGEYDGFSPALIVRGGQVVGFKGANIGALLHRGIRPGFARMEAIRPVTKLRAFRLKAARFVGLLLDRGVTNETRAEGIAFLKAQRPDLADGFAFCQALQEEEEAVAAVRAGAMERERAARERRELERKRDEFIRLVDRAATGGAKLTRHASRLRPPRSRLGFPISTRLFWLARINRCESSIPIPFRRPCGSHASCAVERARGPVLLASLAFPFRLCGPPLRTADQQPMQNRNEK